MSTIKDLIPTEQALEDRLENSLAKGLDEFLVATENRRALVRQNLQYVLVALGFLLALMLFLYLSKIDFTSMWEGKIVLMFALLWATVLLVTGRTWFSNSKLLAQEINMALVPILGNLFRRPFMYTSNQDNTETVAKALTESSLLTVKNINTQADDTYQLFGDTGVQFHELVVTTEQKARRGSGEEVTSVLFKGLLVVATLPQQHAAETYVTTQNDRSGFANRSFWNDVFESGNVTETELEWNDFEKVFHIASSDAAAAREILSPQFMQDLYDWWNEHQLDIRISFKQDKLYLLIPEKTIKISASTTSRKLSVIKKYAATLARPMWRSLVLIEDASGGRNMV